MARSRPRPWYGWLSDHGRSSTSRTLARAVSERARALAELANLEAILTLPKPTVHVVSDVHGEYVKLRHVINNASGSLRPLVEQLFAGSSTPAELTELLQRDLLPARDAGSRWPRDEAAGARCCSRLLPRDGRDHPRARAAATRSRYVERIIPDPFDAMVRELLFARASSRARPSFVDATGRAVRAPRPRRRADPADRARRPQPHRRRARRRRRSRRSRPAHRQGHRPRSMQQPNVVDHVGQPRRELDGRVPRPRRRDRDGRARSRCATAG